MPSKPFKFGVSRTFSVSNAEELPTIDLKRIYLLPLVAVEGYPRALWSLQLIKTATKLCPNAGRLLPCNHHLSAVVSFMKMKTYHQLASIPDIVSIRTLQTLFLIGHKQVYLKQLINSRYVNQSHLLQAQTLLLRRATREVVCPTWFRTIHPI